MNTSTEISKETVSLNTMPFVSIIVPVYNDARRIAICLEALRTQTYPRELYEVVVVDNGSTDNSLAVIQGYPVTCLVADEAQSSYVARNKGLAHSRGEIIGFTDSDCIPSEDWIEKGVARLKVEPNCGLVAGKIEIFFRNPKRPTLVELYESVTAFPQQEYVERYRFGATANVFTHRSIVDKVGPFDERFKSSGDRQWGERVAGAGYDIVYADEVRIGHPARHSFGELHKKYVRTIAGVEDLRGKNGYSLTGFVKRSIKDVLPPVKAIASVWSDDRLARVEQKLKVTLVMLALGFVHAWSRFEVQLNRTRSRRRSRK